MLEIHVHLGIFADKTLAYDGKLMMLVALLQKSSTQKRYERDKKYFNKHLLVYAEQTEKRLKTKSHTKRY